MPDDNATNDVIRHNPDYLVPVVENKQLGSNSVQLTVDAPAIAASAQPGQFVNVTAGHFLRRPIGIMAVDRDQGLVKMGIRVQGKGSLWLSQCRPGDALSLLGPFGHGFTLDGYEQIITVGGGTGVFPLYFVQQVCREMGIDSLAVCGYRSQSESILTTEYEAAGCQVLFASDEGDMGVKGHAALALAQLLRQLPPHPRRAILTCGPRPMMQAVAMLAAEEAISCQVSLEERMACGIGVCLVCVCRIKDLSAQGRDQLVNARCCVDGPVFEAGEVIW